MYHEDNFVYFEKTDSIESIKKFFNKIYLDENLIENRIYGKSDKTLSIEDLIEQVEGFNYQSVTQAEKNNILTVLEKEKNNIDKAYENILKVKVSAFVALMDFIIQHNAQYEHTFLYEKNSNAYIGSFKGIFEKELFNSQVVAGENPLSFSINDMSIKKDKLPKFDFNKSLESNSLLIKKHFLADMDESQFTKIYKDYVKIKNKLENKTSVKLKF